MPAVIPRSDGITIDMSTPLATPTQSTISASAPTASSSVNVVDNPPLSIPGVVGVVVGLLAVLVIVFGGWKYTLWKRRKASNTLAFSSKISTKRSSYNEAIHVDLGDVSIYMEKPKEAYLVASYGSDAQVGWVPQIKTTYHERHPSSISQIKSQHSRASSAASRASVKKEKSKTPAGTPGSPPPAYDFSQTLGDASTSSFTSQMRQHKIFLTPPSPPAPTANSSKTPRAPGLQLTVPSFDSDIPAPLASPARSESFVVTDVAFRSADSASEISNGDSGSDSERPSRFMSVLATFTPSLSDELDIKLGETVRLLEEYRDHWCLIQYIGGIDARKGVVPRFCLEERRNVVQTHKSKLSSSSPTNLHWV